MGLLLINKYPEHLEEHQIRVIRRLSDIEKNLLAGFFVLDELQDKHQLNALHTLCRMIHERDLWIQCDCIRAGRNPVFRINKSSGGNLYLHRITSRADHTSTCIFKRLIGDGSGDSSQITKPFLKKNSPFRPPAGILVKKGHVQFLIQIAATTSSDRQFVLPDFLIKKGDKTLVLEVNGSIEEEYLERKERTHSLMQHLGDVFSFDACGAEKKDRLNFLMSQFITQIKNHLTSLG